MGADKNKMLRDMLLDPLENAPCVLKMTIKGQKKELKNIKAVNKDINMNEIATPNTRQNQINN